MHVVLRTVSDVGNLRRAHAYRAFRRATANTAKRDDFRILHLSIQRSHLHLLVEAADNIALSRGMQGFEISAAKHINTAIGIEQTTPRRKGCVFPDRYHATVITSPRQARHALAYVLGNWRKHREDLHSRRQLDEYSTASQFPHWTECVDAMLARPADDKLLIIKPPQTWLMAVGWRHCTPTISCWETPQATA